MLPGGQIFLLPAKLLLKNVKAGRVLHRMVQGLPTTTMNKSLPERPGRKLHGSSDLGPHK